MLDLEIRRPPLAIVTVAASLACHIASFLLYGLRHDVGPSFSMVDAQVLILGTLLCAGTLGTFFVRGRSASRLILLARLFLYFALCGSHSTWFDIRLLLLSAVVLEVGIYEPFPVNLVAAGAAIVAGLVAMELAPVISSGASPETASRVILFVLLPSIVGISASYLTKYREKLLETINGNEHLSIAVSQLARSNLLLQDAAFHAAEESRDSERHRVAREIHDTVGYTLTNFIMMMEAATDLVFDYPEELQRMMQAARDQAKAGLEETRRSLRELREYEDLAIQGLPAIAKLVSTYDTVGSVQVEAEYCNAPMSFGEEIDLMLFHFVQEGLTNALRHGRATRIWIRLWVEGGVLRLTIRDNGMGSVSMSEGIGLSGMRERVKKRKGSIKAGNVVDGFQISLRVPIGARREENRHA